MKPRYKYIKAIHSPGPRCFTSPYLVASMGDIECWTSFGGHVFYVRTLGHMAHNKP